MPVSISVNPKIAEMEYAVRGPIPIRAAEMARQGKKTVLCNIGNPQAFGQTPISYYREALSLLESPERIARERKLGVVSETILEICEGMLAQLPSGVGAYTESQGPLFIRKAVAKFIDQRDGVSRSGGVAADPEKIFLTNGASEAARNLIDLLISGPRDGIMIPIPQYPLYSASIKRAGGVQVNYYLDEESGWTLNKPILEKAFAQAKRKGIRVKAIVVINPGNPTGAILPASAMTEVVEFAQERGLAILADEVYQENLYGAEFVSFAKLVGTREVPLFSLHSTSKGFCGECGRRGGYVEIRNPPRVKNSKLSFPELLFKQASVSLCSNTIGQALTYLMVTPPPKGSSTAKQFAEERGRVLSSLYEKAEMIRGAFRKMNGVECFGRTGALYLFPRLDRLPRGTNDFDYCMNLLESTGLCTVNGAGFGQRPGTNHLRVAFLPPREMLEEVLPAWVKFHNAYVK
ncbi:MAG: aminotransferase class I/II-fold pyridoxal phosphate-dependent enzyme [Pseudomonadota bacterium]